MADKPKTPATTPPAALPITQEFFFSGGTEYVPITIEAETFEEALKLYEKRRVPVSTPAPLPEEKGVE